MTIVKPQFNFFDQQLSRPDLKIVMLSHAVPKVRLKEKQQSGYTVGYTQVGPTSKNLRKAAPALDFRFFVKIRVQVGVQALNRCFYNKK
jgi:hypothetical protein